MCGVTGLTDEGPVCGASPPSLDCQKKGEFEELRVPYQMKGQ